MLKAVIFDLNGVFVQGEYLSKRIEEKFGIPQEKFLPILKDVMNKIRKPGNLDSFESWKPRLQEIGLDIAKDEFFDFWFSGEHVAPELIEYSKELRQQGFKVFILSNF